MSTVIPLQQRQNDRYLMSPWQPEHASRLVIAGFRVSPRPDWVMTVCPRWLESFAFSVILSSNLVDPFLQFAFVAHVTGFSTMIADYFIVIVRYRVFFRD